MTSEELLQKARASFAPSDDEVHAKALELVAGELTSKQLRVSQIEEELQTARNSLSETEDLVAALAPQQEASNEVAEG